MPHPHKTVVEDPAPSPDCPACAAKAAAQAAQVQPPAAGTTALAVPDPAAIKSSQVSPVGYAVGGGLAGWVLASFFGMNPLFGAALGAGGGYAYGRVSAAK